MSFEANERSQRERERAEGRPNMLPLLRSFCKHSPLSLPLAHIGFETTYHAVFICGWCNNLADVAGGARDLVNSAPKGPVRGLDGPRFITCLVSRGTWTDRGRHPIAT